MKRDFLMAALLTFAVIGCADVQTAQYNPNTTPITVEPLSPTTLAPTQTDP